MTKRQNDPEKDGAGKETMRTLGKDFYLRENVVDISRELLGKVLCTRINGKFTAGIITETEAYAGITDRASHAYGNRRTARTETMYSEGGVAYIYLCYGVHHLFNVVTNEKDIPDAVLVRALHPIEGIGTILRRRGKTKYVHGLATGPGSLTQALGITTRDDKTDLSGNRIWIEDRGINIRKTDIETGKRVGVDYAGEDAGRPYRFMATCRDTQFGRLYVLPSCLL